MLLRVFLQNNNHCREKHGWYISLQEIQARAMVPKHFSQSYPRMLHFKKKEEYVVAIWPTLQTNSQEKTDNAPPDRYGVKIWKVNTLRWSKGHTWDNVTVLEEHTSGTPLYTSSSWYTPGKFWYTLGCTIHPVDKHWSKVHNQKMPTKLSQNLKYNVMKNNCSNVLTLTWKKLKAILAT